MIEIFNRNDTYIIGGIIKSIRPAKGNTGNKLSVVELVSYLWNKDKKINEEVRCTVDCWNNEENNLAEKVLNMQRGTYITFKCRKKEDNAYIAQRMKTVGIWNFPDEGPLYPERNVLIGIISNVTESRIPGQYTQVTMPVNVFEKSANGYNKKTVWSDIRFWNNEELLGRNDAKNAEFLLSPTNGHKTRAVLICSGNVADKTRKNPLYNGKRFIVIKK